MTVSADGRWAKIRIYFIVLKGEPSLWKNREALFINPFVESDSFFKNLLLRFLRTRKEAPTPWRRSSTNVIGMEYLYSCSRFALYPPSYSFCSPFALRLRSFWWSRSFPAFFLFFLLSHFPLFSLGSFFFRWLIITDVNWDFLYKVHWWLCSSVHRSFHSDWFVWWISWLCRFHADRLGFHDTERSSQFRHSCGDFERIWSAVQPPWVSLRQKDGKNGQSGESLNQP